MGDNFACPFCPGYATIGHHIIPRVRTSKKHPASWLNDPRNVLWVCVECHYTGVDVGGLYKLDLHTKEGIRLCIQKQMGLHPGWDFGESPWGKYL